MDRRDPLGELVFDNVAITVNAEKLMADFEGLSDHFILRMYEFLPRPCRRGRGNWHCLVGLPARERAEKLLAEINRRGLHCRPINWPATHLETDAKRALDR